MTSKNGLSVEAGYTDYLNGYADYNKDSVERFVKVAYSIGIGAKMERNNDNTLQQ